MRLLFIIATLSFPLIASAAEPAATPTAPVRQPITLTPQEVDSYFMSIIQRDPMGALLMQREQDAAKATTPTAK